MEWAHIVHACGSWDGEERHGGRFPFCPTESVFSIFKVSKSRFFCETANKTANRKLGTTAYIIFLSNFFQKTKKIERLLTWPETGSILKRELKNWSPHHRGRLWLCMSTAWALAKKKLAAWLQTTSIFGRENCKKKILNFACVPRYDYFGVLNSRH
jgi:hypothetical protein